MNIGMAFAAAMVIGNGPCDSRPCQHDGQCTEVTVPQPGSGGHRHRYLQQADHQCSMADMVQLLETVDAQCCASEDDNCTTGMPTTCSAACAAVFLPFWDRCGSLFDEQTYAHFVADCQSVPRAEPCSLRAEYSPRAEPECALLRAEPSCEPPTPPPPPPTPPPSLPALRPERAGERCDAKPPPAAAGGGGGGGCDAIDGSCLLLAGCCTLLLTRLLRLARSHASYAAAPVAAPAPTAAADTTATPARVGAS